MLTERSWYPQLHSELTLTPLGSFGAQIGPNVPSCSSLLIPHRRKLRSSDSDLISTHLPPYPHTHRQFIPLPVPRFPSTATNVVLTLVVLNRSPWLCRRRIKPPPPTVGICVYHLISWVDVSFHPDPTVVPLRPSLTISCSPSPRLPECPHHTYAYENRWLTLLDTSHCCSTFCV